MNDDLPRHVIIEQEKLDEATVHGICAGLVLCLVIEGLIALACYVYQHLSWTW